MRAVRLALTVRDLTLCETFYRDVIGLSVISRSPGASRLGVAGQVFLELLHHRQAKPEDPRSAGLYHAAFLLPSRLMLGRWLDHALRSDVAMTGAADHLVSEAIYLDDPEGNGVEIYADRPAETWCWDGGHVRIATQPLRLEALLQASRATPGRWSGAPAGTVLGHVHLRVGDVAVAERFYTGLGFTTVARRAAAAFMSTRRYHHHVAVNSWTSLGAGLRPPDTTGLSSLTIAVASHGPSAKPGRGHMPETDLRDPCGITLRLEHEGLSS